MGQEGRQCEALGDLGGTWALSPKAMGSHGRMLSVGGVQSNHILTGSLWLLVENGPWEAHCA